MPATDVPWMRAKEVWVHGVDLDAGLAFADLPRRRLHRPRRRRPRPVAARDQTLDVTIVAPDVDRTWGSGATAVDGPGHRGRRVADPLRRLGLTGPVPQPPTWL